MSDRINKTVDNLEFSLNTGDLPKRAVFECKVFSPTGRLKKIINPKPKPLKEISFTRTKYLKGQPGYIEGFND